MKRNKKNKVEFKHAMVRKNKHLRASKMSELQDLANTFVRRCIDPEIGRLRVSRFWRLGYSWFERNDGRSEIPFELLNSSDKILILKYCEESLFELLKLAQILFHLKALRKLELWNEEYKDREEPLLFVICETLQKPICQVTGLYDEFINTLSAREDQVFDIESVKSGTFKQSLHSQISLKFDSLQDRQKLGLKRRLFLELLDSVIPSLHTKKTDVYSLDTFFEMCIGEGMRIPESARNSLQNLECYGISHSEILEILRIGQELSLRDLAALLVGIKGVESSNVDTMSIMAHYEDGMFKEYVDLNLYTLTINAIRHMRLAELRKRTCCFSNLSFSERNIHTMRYQQTKNQLLNELAKLYSDGFIEIIEIAIDHKDDIDFDELIGTDFFANLFTSSLFQKLFSRPVILGVKAFQTVLWEKLYSPGIVDELLGRLRTTDEALLTSPYKDKLYSLVCDFLETLTMDESNLVAYHTHCSIYRKYTEKSHSFTFVIIDELSYTLFVITGSAPES